ncbi:hypothetical protein LPJ78_002770 [Coemansia sp. RSA 989]|nr:hypothetical protein BX667DRAFT_504140 [Coemansia mojavensis]KAJ1865358.1 hypothetical protein LPJ78_002770 [Coemansia sp. RSA 989]KAJ1874606.1 hypothetical protein LPJ55_001339 [Coemansia sp. RSA 990]
MIIPAAEGLVLRDLASECVSGQACFQRIAHPALPASQSAASSISIANAGTLDTSFTENKNMLESKAADDTSAKDATKSRLERILCNDKNCSQTSDWLMFVPNAPVAWALGSLAVLLSMPLFTFEFISNARGKKLTISLWFAGCAMVEMFISLFLRASLTLSTGNKLAIYKAHLFFNYHGALQLIAFLVSRMWLMSRHGGVPNTDFTVLRVVNFQARPGERGMNHIISANLVATILYIVGVCKMFAQDKAKDVAGIHLIEAALLFVLMLLCVMSVYFVVAGRRQFSKLTIPARLLFVLTWAMVVLWHSFMLARAFVSVDNVARTSEVMFYMLNFAPIFVCGLAFWIYERYVMLKAKK